MTRHSSSALAEARAIVAPGQLVLDLTAASAPTEPQDGLRALVEHVLHCSACRAELSPGDRGQNRALCVACRARREQDLAAERSFAAGLTGKPGRCRCLRRSISINGDGPRRCFHCGRTP